MPDFVSYFVLFERTSNLWASVIKWAKVIEPWAKLQLERQSDSEAYQQASGHAKENLKSTTKVIPESWPFKNIYGAKAHPNILKKLDILLHWAIRQWFRLPTDTPLSFLHALIQHGGIAFPCISVSIPLLQKARLTKILNNTDQTFDSKNCLEPSRNG